jgi:hypothetical protein
VKWRAADAHRPVSPVAAGAGGVRLAVAAGAPTAVTVEIGGGPLDAGSYDLRLAGAASAPVHARLTLESGALLADVALAGGKPFEIVTVVVHPGGVLRLAATLTSDASSTLLVEKGTLVSAGADPRPAGS